MKIAPLIHVFMTSEVANMNLLCFGMEEKALFCVGNVMINILLANCHRFVKPMVYDKFDYLENVRRLSSLIVAISPK